VGGRVEVCRGGPQRIPAPCTVRSERYAMRLHVRWQMFCCTGLRSHREDWSGGALGRPGMSRNGAVEVRQIASSTTVVSGMPNGSARLTGCYTLPILHSRKWRSRHLQYSLPPFYLCGGAICSQSLSACAPPTAAILRPRSEPATERARARRSRHLDQRPEVELQDRGLTQ